MSNNDLEKAKEVLRQGELRIKGILDFSKEIDDKIFKLLASAVAISSGLIFFLLKNGNILEINFKYSCIFSIIILCLIIIFLLMAGKPARYRGVGLPAQDFCDEKDLKDILMSSKDRYEARFNHNKSLNKQKNFWLKHALYLFVFLPFLTSLFYLSTLFFPVIIIVFSWLLFTTFLYGLFYKFIIKN